MFAGLAVQYGMLAIHQGLPPVVVQAVGFGAGAMLVYGGSLVAVERGYTRWVGFMALGSFIGVGILLMMPDPNLSVLLRWLSRDRARDPDAHLVPNPILANWSKAPEAEAAKSDDAKD